MDCNICCESINKALRREVQCPYCEFVTCLICFRKYLLESSKVADCMSCHRELSLDFLQRATPKSFYNEEYRKKRADDLLSQEKSLLPDTQHLVEAYIKRKKDAEEISELMEEDKYLRFRIREIRARVLEIRTNPRSATDEPEKERKKFIMGCPVGECRGFLSQALKCGTCGIYVCSKCHTVKDGREDDAHVCDKDTVATVSLLKHETKPCPKCAVPIFKINGCDQMYCVECHTPFSWNTGKVVGGVIHNPHYYQWQREQNNGVAPRVPGDRHCGGGCGDLPWPETIEHIMQQRKQTFPHMEDCHRLVEHVRAVVIPRYPATIGMLNNIDLRVQFLAKELDEDKWRRSLKMRQKKAEKDRAVNQVLEMFVATLTDLFTTYVTGATDNLHKDAEALRVYSNRELHKISRHYNNKTPNIKVKWVCP